MILLHRRSEFFKNKQTGYILYNHLFYNVFLRLPTEFQLLIINIKLLKHIIYNYYRTGKLNLYGTFN